MAVPTAITNLTDEADLVCVPIAPHRPPSPNGTSFVPVPLGSAQRSGYAAPRNVANPSDLRNQPPEWARFAYEAIGDGLNRAAIIKVELNPLDDSPFYGTQPETWTSNPADGHLGVHNIKVTGMMESASTTTAQVRLYSNSGFNVLLDNGGAVPQAERGVNPANPIVVPFAGSSLNSLVPFFVNLKLGRSKNGLSGPLGVSENTLSSNYALHVTIENGTAGSGTNVLGWEYFGRDDTPTVRLTIPGYILPTPMVAGLTITLNGAIPLGPNGIAGTNISRIYEDAFVNVLLDSTFVTSVPVPGGWLGLLAPYSKTVILTRTTTNKIKGNTNNTYGVSAYVYQYLVGIGEYSSNAWIPEP